MSKTLAFLVVASIVFAASPAEAQTQRSAGTALVLIPGAGGAVPNDFLIRNQQNLAAYGLATAVATSSSQAASTASGLRAQGYEVVLVGMSAGTPTVAEALAMGAPASKTVFVAGALMPGSAQRSVAEALGSPARLRRRWSCIIAATNAGSPLRRRCRLSSAGRAVALACAGSTAGAQEARHAARCQRMGSTGAMRKPCRRSPLSPHAELRGRALI